jgi:hypothetical protein
MTANSILPLAGRVQAMPAAVASARETPAYDLLATPAGRAG